MSLRDEGGEEECFEYDGQDEERELAPAQQDTLDLAEEGKFLLCPIGCFCCQCRGGLAASLSSQRSFLSLLSSNVKHREVPWKVAQ